MKFLNILSVAMLTGSVAYLTSCSEEEKRESPKPINIKIVNMHLCWEFDGSWYDTLSFPNVVVTFDDQTLVSGTSAKLVDISMIRNSGTYTFTLTSDSSWLGSMYKKSVVKKSFDITVLNEPNELTFDSESSSFTWGAVSQASSYLIDVDGNRSVAETNKFTVSGRNKRTAKVKAVGNGSLIFDSDFSEPLSIRYLDAPTNIHFQAGVITWEPVEGAQTYTVYEGSTQVLKTLSTSYKVPLNSYGKLSYTIVANGNNLDTFDSLPSKACVVNLG